MRSLSVSHTLRTAVPLAALLTAVSAPAARPALAQSPAAGATPARVTIEELVAEGDRVAKRWELHATHTGELLGVAATGRPVAVRAVTVYGFDARGKVREIWWNHDALGLMQQIGAVPAAV